MEQVKQKQEEMRNLIVQATFFLGEILKLDTERQSIYDSIKEEIRVVDKDIEVIEQRIEVIRQQEHVCDNQETLQLTISWNDKLKQKYKIMEQKNVLKLKEKVDSVEKDIAQCVTIIRKTYEEIRILCPLTAAQYESFVQGIEAVIAAMT